MIFISKSKATVAMATKTITPVVLSTRTTIKDLTALWL